MHPAHAPVDRAEIARLVARHGAAIEAAAQETSQKWACQQLARALIGLSYWRETSAVAGFPHRGQADRAAILALMKRALAALAQRLEGASPGTKPRAR